ncbi:16350_t:CDS:2 [Cetraspora pellucida]|uniref:16350_t:CDS:1 n=1 Tax=Cetraspora pellucida TaxID=1433469 RepID=A0ACA9LEP6_9GLOM|nr:16350_t:CDS:2 [Cetraspora pellucida]
MGNEVNQSPAAATARELMKQKDAIENKIKEFEQVLSTQRVGMHEPLVDSSGFPRSDIDLMTVRTALYCSENCLSIVNLRFYDFIMLALQNDHKDIMSRIESALHEIHAENNTNRRLEETNRDSF